MLSGLAKKKMLSSTGAKAVGMIIAVSDEKDMSRNLLGNTCVLKSLPAAMMNTLL